MRKRCTSATRRSADRRPGRPAGCGSAAHPSGADRPEARCLGASPGADAVVTLPRGGCGDTGGGRRRALRLPRPPSVVRAPPSSRGIPRPRTPREGPCGPAFPGSAACGRDTGCASSRCGVEAAARSVGACAPAGGRRGAGGRWRSRGPARAAGRGSADAGGPSESRPVSLGQLRPVGREPVTDVPQPREVVDVAGQRGHFGHRHLGVARGEAVARALLAGEQPHALGVQPQQARGELVHGGLGGGTAVPSVPGVVSVTAVLGGASGEPSSGAGVAESVVFELPYVSGELRRPAFPSP